MLIDEWKRTKSSLTGFTGGNRIDYRNEQIEHESNQRTNEWSNERTEPNEMKWIETRNETRIDSNKRRESNDRDEMKWIEPRRESKSILKRECFNDKYDAFYTGISLPRDGA